MLLLPLLLFTFLVGCSYVEEISDAEIHGPQAEIGGEIPCSELPNLGFDISVEYVVPSDYYGGGDYEFAVEVTGGGAADVPVGCTCIDNVYCIVLSFPISIISHAGISKIINGVPSPITQIPVTTQGTFLGYEPLGGVPGDPLATAKFCNYNPDYPSVIFFNLPAGFPSGMDPLEAISDQLGICIVGDYPDPNDGTDTGDNGASGDTGGNG